MEHDRDTEGLGWWHPRSAHWTRTGSIAGIGGVIIAMIGLVVSLYVWQDGKQAQQAGASTPAPRTTPVDTGGPAPAATGGHQLTLDAADAAVRTWSPDVTILTRSTVCVRVTYTNGSGAPRGPVRIKVARADLLYTNQSTCADLGAPTADGVVERGDTGYDLGHVPAGGRVSFIIALVPNVDLGWACEARAVTPTATTNVDGGSTTGAVTVRVRKNC